MAAGLLRAAQHSAPGDRGPCRTCRRGDRSPAQAARHDRSRPTAWWWPPAPGRPRCCCPLGVALPIEPQRGQIVHLRVPGQDTRDWPVVLPPGSHYLLAFDDSRLSPARRARPVPASTIASRRPARLEVLAEALHVAPGLATATVIETRVGFRPVGPAIRPLLGPVRGLDGLLIGNGLGAAGLTIGPYAGRCWPRRRWATRSSLDLTPFALRRRARPAGIRERQ